MITAIKNIIHKLETLTDSMVNEVKDFVDFLKAKHTNSFPKSGKQDILVVEEPKSLYCIAKGLFIIPKNFKEPINF